MAFPAGTSGGSSSSSFRFSGTVTSMVAAVFMALQVSHAPSLDSRSATMNAMKL
ncbi:MAG: hypothetical protein L6Q84_05390 [Polyangiaceae bacterium]|nr:hypothetical protein [Polyangiaceae bacterium]